MKKFTLLTALFVFIAVAASAQIKIGVGGGYAKATGDFGKDASGGIDFYINGAYFLNPKLAVGLEYNSSLIVAFKTDGSDVDATGISGILAKGEYFFFDRKVTPYVGLGLGLYTVETPEVTSGGQVVVPSESSTNFGFSPEIGFKLGVFNINWRYHMAGDAPIGDDKVNYMQFNIGFAATFGK